MRFTTTLLSLFFACSLFSQSGTWTWMKGSTSSTSNPVAVYGQLGIPDTANTPPGLFESPNWTDKNGNFWIFGGYFYGPGEVHSALWMFSPHTNMWTWMGGPSMDEGMSIWGTQGVPSTNNCPGGRMGSATWVDSSGDLWLFGGWGKGINGFKGALNDLWKYHIATKEWTWVGGSKDINNRGNAGSILVEASTNWPHSRHETYALWCDNNDNLWLYGGTARCGFASNTLWRYNTQNNMWTWMNGDTLCGYTYPVYGTFQVEASDNTPGGRFSPTSYYEKSTGFMWLFPGSTNIQNGYSDVWRYNPTTNKWAWMAGPQGLDNDGVYNEYCKINESYPPARTENTHIWGDGCGHIWWFGGGNAQTGGMSDMWMYNTNLNDYILISGTDTFNDAGNYGTREIPASSNYPPGNRGGVSFTDTLGNFWMFGGRLAHTNNCPNTLWKYTPDYSCSIPPEEMCDITFINETKISSAINIYPNPANEMVTVSFKNLPVALYTIELYATDGHLLYSSVTKEQQHTVNLSAIPAGLYIVKLTCNDNSYIQKLCISK